MEITYNEACELIAQADALPIEGVEKLAKERLKKIVSYAKSHSSYFANLYKDIDTENFELGDLPPTFKSDLMQHQQEWFTDPAIKNEDVFNYLDELKYLEGPFLGKYTTLTTSGTTGKPMIMVRDSYHNTIHGALMQKRLLRGIDADLFDPKLYRSAGVICTEGHCSSYLAYLRMRKAYESHADNIRAISITNNPDVTVAELNEFDPVVLSGYPSILANLGNEKLQGRLKVSPKIIACSAETLSPENYELLRKAFDCPVLNNYCSTEGGEVAMSCSCGKLHINLDWIIVEAVDQDCKPVPDGVFSDSVLITDLTNFVQPIIRYQMGDSIRISHEACACGSKLPVMEIIGRVSDPFLINGREVPSLQLIATTGDIEGVLDRQFIQHEPDFIECRCLLTPEADRNHLFEQLNAILQQYLQANHASSELRTSICEKPLIQNQKGGKVRTVLNLCKKR